MHDVNLITYGFPCQDISQAGHQKGFFDKNGNITRSGLFFDALKIIKDTKPEYAIAENVKALTSKKFTAEFATVLDSLEQVGYNNYYKVLNAKDFGIPQNRERVFIVSIRKDIDFKFTFPMGEPLKLRLADLLENEVDPKFYLSDEQIKRIKTSSYCSAQRRIQSKEWCDTLRARDWKDPKCVKVKQAFNDFKVRKLTPLECWRLMDFDDEDFYKARNAGISNSQLYKQAGNSIVVKVLQTIFRQFNFEKVA